jgi:epoxyqueuosine reductase QueG
MTDQQKIKECLTACGVSVFGITPFTPDLLLPSRAKHAVDRQFDLIHAKSVIVCAFPYYTGTFEQRNLSLYAMLPDYHAIVIQKLTRAADALSDLFAGFSFRPFVDMSPLCEVQAAVSAGLGARGVNTQLICEKWGSLVFLGELVTDAAFFATNTRQIQVDCQSCQKCVDACPTGALHDGLLDAAKCRSAITQKKGSLTPWEEEQITQGGLVWGCDICTLACPHNAHPPITPICEFVQDVSPVLTEQNLDALLADRAFSWRGKEVLARNLQILAKTNRKDGHHDL